MKIRTQINKLFDKKTSIDEKIKEIQDSCPHKISVYEACGNGGSWDDDDRYYWYSFYCYDCRKIWTTEQKYGIYGDSLNVKKIDRDEKPEKIELLIKMRDLK